MSDAQREWLKRLIVLAFVFLAGYMVEGAAQAVFGWLAEVVLEACALLHVPSRWATLGAIAMAQGVTAARFIALGFAYAMLAGGPWRRAGAVAWLVFSLLRWLPVLAALGGVWFLLEAAVSLVAAMTGARLYEENRRHPNVQAVRDAVLGSRFLSF